MASWKPEIYDADEVVAYYDSSDAVTFRVYVGTKPDPAYLRFTFDQTQPAFKAEGVQLLTDACRKILSNKANTNPYLLEIVRPGKGKGGKSVTTNITFQLNQQPSFGQLGYGNQAVPIGNTSPELVQILQKMTEQNNLIISKLSAEEGEEEEPGVAGAVKHSNPLIGFIDNPATQGIIAGALGEWLKKVLKLPAGAVGADHLMITNLNGMDTSAAEIQHAVDILKKHDPNIAKSLMKLAMLAENNPDYFKQLISMLNSM